MTPNSDSGAEDVVQIPDEKPESNGTHPNRDHSSPHGAENLQVSTISSCLLRFIRGRDIVRALAAKRWPKSHFHSPHAPKEDDGCQQGKRVLMKQWILDIVIVARDEDGDECGEQACQHGIQHRPSVRKDGVEHDTRGVNHGQLIEKLHFIFALEVSRAFHRIDIQQNEHLRVAWNKKLPRPITK